MQVRVDKVEVLVTMTDGSAHSLVTDDGSTIESAIFAVERSCPDPPWSGPPYASFIHQLTMTVDGPDIRFTQQYHEPASEERP
jgi:hypothetical protein